MAASPSEFALELTPRARVDVFDVRAEVSSRYGDALSPYPRALCCSFHTTAGYLDRGVAARLNQGPDGVMPYIDVFRTMFPEGAGYEHDKIERRTELSPAQRPQEPLNADSHLAFMAGRPQDLRGVSESARASRCRSSISTACMPAGPRTRHTSVIGYSAEEAVATGAHRRSGFGPQCRIGEPEGSASRRLRAVRRSRASARRGQGAHPPFTGARRAACGPDRQRVRDAPDASRPVGSAARSAAVHGGKGGAHARQSARDSRAGRSTTRSTISCASSIASLTRWGCGQSRVENVLSRAIAMPASRFLRMKRSVSLLVSDRDAAAKAAIVEGTYQSPILVQWHRGNGRMRVLDVTVTRFMR